MSDQSPSSDELASALLDGEATASSPLDATVTVRMEELGRASEAIAAPVPVDEDAKERSIAAALAEFDALSGPHDVDEPTAAVTPLPQRRRWMPVVAGAAAAVVVLIGIVAVTQRDDTKSGETAAIAAGPAASVATTMASGLAGGGVASDRGASSNGDALAEAASPANPPSPAGAFTNIGDDDQLRAAIAAVSPEDIDTAPDACEQPARESTSEDLGTFAGSLRLQFEGQPARALIFVDDRSAERIVVVGDPSCEVLDRID